MLTSITIKRFFLLLLLLALVAVNTYAQRKITGKVTYDCSLNIGMGLSNFEANLYFNRDSSYFQTVNKAAAKDTSSLLMRDKVLEAKVSVSIKDTIGFKIITDRKNKKLYSREIVINKLIPVYENIPDFKWTIHEETKKIGSNVCQKATCSFRGRNYIAWFAREINIGAGPYKFQGLPGLILELADDKGTIRFVMKDITIPFKGAIPINPQYTPEPISREEYVALAKKAVQRLAQYLQSSNRTDATTGKIKVTSSIIGIEDLDVPY